MIGTGLSRREREVLEVLYRAESATAAEVAAALPDPPSYSSVRSTLAILEEKGHVRHEQDGKRYVYKPTRAPREAARSALRAVLDTFFGGSMAGAVQTFLSDEEAARLTPQELEEMTALLERARASRARTETGEGEGHDGR
jgi:predicted transcriptional regulator